MTKFARLAAVVAALLLLDPSNWRSASAQGSGQPQDPPQGPVIKVDTVLVTLPVIVTDRYGQFVTGLGQKDFAVREDGVRQEISNFSSTEAPFNVALLIDTSRSTQRKLASIRKAALTFVKQLQPNDRVLIVTFDDQVRFICDWTSDRATLKRAIESVKSNFATSLYDALYLTVTKKMDPLVGRKAIVVLTDGVDTASKKANFEQTLDLISTAGVITYPIQYETRNDGGPVTKPSSLPNPIGSAGSTSQLDTRWVANPLSRSLNPLASMSSGLSFRTAFVSQGVRSRMPEPRRDPYLIARDFMRALALQSGATYHQAETIESTSYAFAMIANELRHQYTLAYYSTNEKRDGGLRAINVGVQPRELIVRTRTAYRAPREVDLSEGAVKPSSQPRP